MNRHVIAAALLIGWFFINNTVWTTPFGGGGKIFLPLSSFEKKEDCDRMAAWVKQKGGDPSECVLAGRSSSSQGLGGIPKEIYPVPAPR